MSLADTDSTKPAATAATPPPAAKAASGESLFAVLGPLIGVFAAVIGLWYLYSGVILTETERNISLPFPHDVLRVSFFDGENLRELLSATGWSALISLIGLIIAVVLGVSIATLMSLQPWIERSLYPYAVLLQTVPILALVPLIGLRFGFGLNARVLVSVIIALFPIITNTLFGLKSAEKGHHDLFTLHGASTMTRLRKLQFPAAMPAMFTGFQIAGGLAVVGAIVGDFFFGRGKKGLGIRIRDYTANLDTEQLIGGIIMSAVLGIIVFWFFGWAKNKVVGDWAPSTTGND